MPDKNKPEEITIPTIYRNVGELKDIWRSRLCTEEICMEDRCVECAFSSPENFDKFIKQVGL